MFIETLILTAIFLVLSEFLKPKPKVENQRPAGLGDFQFPTAMEGRPVPIVWGTVKLAAPNVIWYGDLRNEAITKKVKTGLFSSKRVTTGFRYYIGVQCALCRGLVDEVRRIWVGDDILSTDVVSVDGGTISVDQPNFFGGEETGAGGMVGTFRFYRGSKTQGVNAYLTPFQTVGGGQPAYRGTAYMVWEGGLIGTSTQIKNWAFEVRRIPNGLGLATPSVNGGNDANPMNVIYELMTNTEWGLRIDPGRIDVANFVTAANTLRTEGNGFSLILDSTTNAADFLQELERQIDGVVYLDRATNLWRVTLARGGYSIPSLPVVNQTNVIQLKSFSRGAWQDTTNEVLVKFDSRTRDYMETYARSQDPANIRLQGNRTVSTEQSYPGVKDANLANNIAWRSLRVLTYPLARATVVVNRTFYDRNIGDLVRLNYPELGIVDLPMRITKIDLGLLSEGQIELTLVQDVFTFDSPSFAAPPGGSWTPPNVAAQAVPAIDSLAFAAPRAFCVRAETNPGVLDRIWSTALPVGANAYADLFSRPTGSGTYSDSGDLGEFGVAGSLSAPLTQVGTQGSISITVDCTPTSQSRWIQSFGNNATQEDVGSNLLNLVLINGEWFGFRTITPVGGTQVTLGGGYRGLLDTPITSHSAGDRVWLGLGNITDRNYTGDADFKIIPSARGGALPEASAPNIGPISGLTPSAVSNRARRPYLPVNLTFNGTVWPTGSVSIDATNLGSGIDQRGTRLTFTRKDFRTGDEAAAVLSEATLPGDFPTANTTQYQVEVRRRPVDGGALLFTIPWNAGTGTFDILRTSIIRNMPGGAVPAGLEARVFVRHTVESVVRQHASSVNYVFTTDSALYAGRFAFGARNTNVATAAYTALDTGTHTVTIGTALGGAFAVEVRINGGAWTPVFSGGSTSGTFSANAGDTIELRHTRNTTFETGVELSFSGTIRAFGVFFV